MQTENEDFELRRKILNEAAEVIEAEAAKAWAIFNDIKAKYGRNDTRYKARAEAFESGARKIRGLTSE